jgi:hypothetical protein
MLCLLLIDIEYLLNQSKFVAKYRNLELIIYCNIKIYFKNYPK